MAIVQQFKDFCEELLKEQKTNRDQFFLKTGINIGRFLDKGKNMSVASLNSVAIGFGFEDGCEMWSEMKRRKKEKEEQKLKSEQLNLNTNSKN